jgi:hypothetical protein
MRRIRFPVRRTSSSRPHWVIGRSPLEAQYLFEEVCAQTLYNMSGEPAPFDADSPYWIVPNALHAAKKMGIETSRVVAIVAG